MRPLCQLRHKLLIDPFVSELPRISLLRPSHPERSPRPPVPRAPRRHIVAGGHERRHSGHHDVTRSVGDVIVRVTVQTRRLLTLHAQSVAGVQEQVRCQLLQPGRCHRNTLTFICLSSAPFWVKWKFIAAPEGISCTFLPS